MSRNVVVALFVALVIGACGSGGNKLSGAKASYVAQVDPICRDLQGQVGDLGSDPGKQAGAIEGAVNKIKTVKEPSEDSERADLFIAALTNTYLSLQDVDQSRMVNDQTRAATALTGAQANAKRASAAAKLYGMKDCAQPL
jgi:hypothetical protein